MESSSRSRKGSEQNDFPIVKSMNKDVGIYKFSSEIKVAQKNIPGLIGKKGWKIEEIKVQTQTLIKIGKASTDDPNCPVPVMIYGAEEKHVNDAKTCIYDYTRSQKHSEIKKVKIPAGHLSGIKRVLQKIKRNSSLEFIHIEESPDGVLYSEKSPSAPITNVCDKVIVVMKGEPKNIEMAVNLIKDQIQKLTFEAAEVEKQKLQSQMDKKSKSKNKNKTK